MADEIHLRDEDRLPWLETVESDEPRGPGAGRMILFVLIGLAILAGIVFAVYRLNRPGPATQASGRGLIAAQDGDYKVKPDDPGGLKVGGEGDSAIATSTGTGAGTGAIDPHQVPEKPVASHHSAAATTPAHGAAVATAAVPASGGRLTAPAPVTAPHGMVPGAGSGGSLVQLGAFPTQAAADAAWSAMARRFGYVATLGKSVEQADVGGRHVFRLRVNAGSANAATDICGRLKVAGEGCFVTAG
ncbi:SPOR domain-containing protein [uncultured Sphingomonas sp.]|uniref:SPOR domain-containing protein n=1 Tax=uncultured Sphingomonas sp. TaxID=158754 RepID=UPI0035CB6D48